MRVTLAYTFLAVASMSLVILAQVTPTPSCSAGPYDLTPLMGKVLTFNVEPPRIHALKLTLCGTLETACGANANELCTSLDYNCTSACESWEDGLNPGAASLGKFESISYDAQYDRIVIANTGGDFVTDTKDRQVIINVTCGPTEAEIVELIQPASAPPGEPFTYYVTMTSIYACAPSTLKAYCKPFLNCDRCAVNGACSWCLDSKSCVPRSSVGNATCKEWIGTPKACPFPTGKCSTMKSCKTCTVAKDEYGGCAWCIYSDGRNSTCVDGDSESTQQCTGGKVMTSANCPPFNAKLV